MPGYGGGIEGTTTAVDAEYGDSSGGWVLWAVLAVKCGMKCAVVREAAGRADRYVIRRKARASSRQAGQLGSGHADRREAKTKVGWPGGRLVLVRVCDGLGEQAASSHGQVRATNTRRSLGLPGSRVGQAWQPPFQALSKHANQIVHALPYAAMSAHTLPPRTATTRPSHVLGGSRPLASTPASLFLPV